MYVNNNDRVSRDDEPPRQLDFDGLAARTADAPLKIPEQLPCRTPAVTQDRFTDSPVYPGLETNVDAGGHVLLPGADPHYSVSVVN